ncbi:uncharacterized protein TrAFT101_001503 [Trichoderma asperellum]|uniref:uncharacterized protein n=1 Tax=Trichoderma asperellum TaxID=101201 RepID=UPI003320BB7C|nr:hypothetical protein TrAFT101_001503 [Trichoderma asperellum]
MPPKRSDEALQLIGGWGFLRLRRGHVKSALPSVEASSIPNLPSSQWRILSGFPMGVAKRNGIYKSTFPFLFTMYQKYSHNGSNRKPVKLSGRAGLK